MASRNHKPSHLRFLSTDGPLVPITASAEVFLLRSHNLLESAHVRSAEVKVDYFSFLPKMSFYWTHKIVWKLQIIAGN